LFGELFKAQTGISMVHVPYRGQGPALEDLIGGRIQAMFPIVPDVIASDPHQSSARSGVGSEVTVRDFA
jgi:tripartite-type tricarboxylate transporter receptor subunit TctC